MPAARDPCFAWIFEGVNEDVIGDYGLSGGGAVFSVGSITFCGSLWRDGWDGPVSRLLENVLQRFSVG